MIDVNKILLFAIILAPTGSDPMFQSLPPSCPIDVIPRNNAPRPTPNRRGPARSMGFTATGGVVVEDGLEKRLLERAPSLVGLVELPSDEQLLCGELQNGVRVS